MTFKQSTPRFQGMRRIAAVGVAACGLLLAGSSFAAGKNTQADAQYKSEKAACTNGTSNQDKATCLREAGAARQEAMRGNLSDPGQAQLKENAMRRCEGLPQANRIDCEKRVNGGGVADGNVRDGGIYRETVTVVPGQPEPAK